MLRDGTSSPLHLGAFSSLKKSYWHWAACMAFQLSQGTAPIPTASSTQEQGPQARRASHSHKTSQRKAGAPPHGQSGELEPPWHLRLAALSLGCCCYACAGAYAMLTPECYANCKRYTPPDDVGRLPSTHTPLTSPKPSSLNPEKPLKCQIYLPGCQSVVRHNLKEASALSNRPEFLHGSVLAG